MSTPAEKQHAHELIERIPADQAPRLFGSWTMLLDPFTRSLANAPVDSQPVSDEEAAALDQAHGAIGRGEGISHEDILQEFALARKP